MTDSNRPITPEGIPGFWAELRRAAKRVLALDYDGTLAPFREERMKAFPVEGVADCLTSISKAGNTTVVIISGRPVGEILELIGDVGLTIIGSHGWEMLTADGNHRLKLPSLEQKRMLQQAEKDVAKLGLEDHAEKKVASVAVHTRGVPRERAARIETQLMDLWGGGSPTREMECRQFNGGVELRSIGIDKGTILLQLLAGEPRATFCVYVGDDETDEDAFGAIRDRGYGVKVGRSTVPTRARGWLPDCTAVLEFLREWDHVSNVNQ